MGKRFQWSEFVPLHKTDVYFCIYFYNSCVKHQASLVESSFYMTKTRKFIEKVTRSSEKKIQLAFNHLTYDLKTEDSYN